MKSTSKISVFIRFSVLVALLAPGIVQAATVKLTVTKAGTGAGTVVSTPVGINCGVTCNFNFTTNTSVKLTATAAAGSKFSAWTNGNLTQVTDPLGRNRQIQYDHLDQPVRQAKSIPVMTV